MPSRLPTRLGSEPIVEVICEIRFAAKEAIAISLLPGLLFEKLGEFEEVVKLPLSELPSNFSSEDAFRYLPHVHLKKENMTISLGPRMMSLAVVGAYPGWTRFKSSAVQIFKILEGRKFVDQLSRISLRYTDIIDVAGKADLSLLNASLRIGDREVCDDPVQIRVDHAVDGIGVVTQIIAPASSTDGRRGIVVDVDTAYAISDQDGFWGEIDSICDKLHDVNKKSFFSMLKEDTLTALKPEYA